MKNRTATLLLLGLALSTPAFAEPPRALPEGQPPADSRLGKLRDLNVDYFPMQPLRDISDWPARRREIRARVLVAAGLHPLPQRSPLHAIVYGKVERDDYTVERVIFESFPGHFVTGSLYRPKAPAAGKLPAVLNPHGHWANGRFYDAGLEGVRKEIAAGAERFEVGGRYVVEARCAQLARMGCIAFVYDMEGVADSAQLQHRAGPRPVEPGKPGYLFFSATAELRGQTMFGLQTWNSIRALDFICSLPEVDVTRIAVTGASGGGTQSMMLGAIDDRLAAVFPAVMVSTAMQGGCACENAPYLRINQGNIDIAAANAPRPLGVTAADDWTKELQTKGDPDLRALYALLGHPENYEAHFHLQFPHNYNSVNRQHMYSFMNRHLRLGLPEPIVERDFVPLDTATEASVWTPQHPKPAGDNVGETHERRVTAEWTRATEAALDQLGKAQRFQVIAEGVTTMVGRRTADVGPVAWRERNRTDAGDGLLMAGALTALHHGEQLPALFLYPKQYWNRQMVIWLTDTGKEGLFGADGKPLAAVAALLGKGYGIATLDMFGQGEFVAAGGGKALASVRLAPPGADRDSFLRAACFTFGYNPPLLAQRVHDVMSLAEFLRQGEGGRVAARIHLVAVGQQAGPVGLAARFMLGDWIHRAAIDTRGFDFRAVERFDDPMFLPGILRYGGLGALWSLNQPLATVSIRGAEDVSGAIAAALR